jgi:hypothetical protein
MTRDERLGDESHHARVADFAAEADDSLDSVFELLANHHRRHALVYLAGMNDETASVSEVLDYVVARNADSVEDLHEAEDVASALHHVHLPKLEAAGVVDYDVRSDTIRYHGQPLLEEGLALAERMESDDLSP